MRLATCIALELAIAAGAVGGVWVGVTSAIRSAADITPAYAASPDRVRAVPEVLPAATLVTLPVAAPAPNNIFGVHDDALLAPLGAAPVTRMKLNRGGTSLSLRLDFANGARASFKPEQTFAQSDPRREIAAFRIDRLLGIGHIAPTKEASFVLKDLLAVAEPPGLRAYYAERLEEATARAGGVVHGELQWWIPDIKLARLAGQRIDEPGGRALWITYLQVGAQPPVEMRGLLAQISTCILFDLLIDNADRWSGSNTMMSPDGRLLYFMDNTLSFSLARFGHEINVLSLRQIQQFSRSVVDAMRALTHDQLVEALAPAPDSKLGPLLKPAEIRAIILRRDHILRYLDQLIEQFGEDAVLAFP